VRIGLVSPYSWTVPGGVNNHIEHLAEELEGRGHETWVIAPVGAVTPARRHVDSRQHAMAERFIPVGSAVPVPSNGSMAYVNFSPRLATRMDRAVRYGRFDVLHVHEPCTPAVSAMAVLMATSPVVGTFHAALDASGYYDQLKWVVAAIMKRIDVRVAVSEAARAFPQSRFPGPYRIIPNGVAVEKYAPALGVPKVRGRILFVGRAEKRKGLGVLLQAFTLLRERAPHATLVIAGATRRQVLETERNGTGLPVELTGVDALGWIADEEKIAHLGDAEIVCAPSLAAESFGIVLAEAMAAGVPVVASDLPGYRAVREADAARRPRRARPRVVRPSAGRGRAAAPRGRRQCRRRRALVGPHHRQHHRGLRGRDRGAAGARLARPARQAGVRPRDAPVRGVVKAERLLCPARRRARRRRSRLTPPAPARRRRPPFCRAAGRMLDSAFATRPVAP
jgi:phosphatidylinositol alpha-mannosyltransferase